MGPLFNGMTIASERNVWAAGQNALEYANKFPQTPPTTPPSPTPTPTPTPEDGECPDSCSDDKTSPATGTTPEEKVIHDALTELYDAVKKIKVAEGDAEKSAEDYLAAHPELQSAIDKLSGVVDFAKHAEEAGKLVASLGVATGPGVVLGLILVAALYLGDWVDDEISKWLTKAVEDGEEKFLNDAIEYLKDNFVIADGPYPATKDHTIGHAPTDTKALLSHMLITYMAGDSKIPNLASKADQGQICSGSPNVYFGGKPVARVSDVVDCNFHCPSKIAQGSKTVFANGQPIARVGSKTTCNGVIKQGVMSIFIDKTFGGASLYVDQGFAPDLLDLAALLSEIAPPNDVAKDLGKSVTDRIDKSVDDAVDGDGSDEAGS